MTLASQLEGLKGEVKLYYSAGGSRELQEIIGELRGNEKLALEEARGQEHPPVLSFKYGEATIAYHGAPKYREAEAFARVISMASSREVDIRGDFSPRIKIFVTPTCNYCPRAVRVSARIAMERGGGLDIYDVLYFRELAERYGVREVPNIIINSTAIIEIKTSESKYGRLILRAMEEVERST